MKEDTTKVGCSKVEILSLAGGEIEGESKLIMTVRHDGVLVPVTWAFSKSQAHRLLKDLGNLLAESPALKGLMDDDGPPLDWPTGFPNEANPVGHPESVVKSPRKHRRKKPE